MGEIKKKIPNQNFLEVIYAGGTISSLATAAGYREGGHILNLVEMLEKKIPALKDRFTIGQAKVAYKGLSENIDEKYWKKIEIVVSNALDRNPKAVIITHGTDTMEQTARRLKHTYGDELKRRNIKIILTGANDDISQPKTDAWRNLMFAFESTNSNLSPDVYVAFHGKLIPANLVIKEPFNGKEMNFVSMKDSIYNDSIRAQDKKEQELITKFQKLQENGDNTRERVLEYPVNIIREDNKEFVRRVTEQNVRAILLILYHSGTANTENPELSISDLVKRLRSKKNIVFFGVTENGEPINLNSYETSVKLREAGVVPLYDMKRAVALEKLKIVASGTSNHIIEEMLDNKFGEIDRSRIINEDIDSLKKLYAQ